jgi:PAS domain S-box-containing protein
MRYVGALYAVLYSKACIDLGPLAPHHYTMACLADADRAAEDHIVMSDPGVQPAAHPGGATGRARDQHMVQFYVDEDFLTDLLSRFIGGALVAGDAAVVIATASHQAELERKLSARGLNTSLAALEGRYLVLNASDTLARLTAAGSVDEARFRATVGEVLAQARNATAGKDCRTVVFGELVALLWAQGKVQEAIRVEQLWNDLAQSYSFSLLCAYPILGFNKEMYIEPFLKICGEHSSIIPSEGYLALNSDQERRGIAQLEQQAQLLMRRLAGRQNEQQFRLLVEAVQDYAIFMLDREGHIVSWNPGAERIKGYKAEQIVGKHFSCFYPEADVRRGKPQQELVIAAKEGRLEDEGWRVRKDGTMFWANVTITAIRNETGKLLGFAKVTRDVTEKMRAERALREEVTERREAQRQLYRSEQSLRQLSLHLLRSQDEERRKIGRDLHDSLGQYLTVLKLKLESIVSLAGPQAEEATQDLAQCILLTNDCIKEVRTVSYLLYPPLLEEVGLRSAIPWYLDGFAARSGIATSFEVGAGFDRLARESELVMFRVLQESLTNVHRHSGSPTAHVRLLMKDGMGVLEIEDAGKGISPQLLERYEQDWMGALGVGLRGMSERVRQLGGKLELVSTEAGTKVSAMVPAVESSRPEG